MGRLLPGQGLNRAGNGRAGPHERSATVGREARPTGALWAYESPKQRVERNQDPRKMSAGVHLATGGEGDPGTDLHMLAAVGREHASQDDDAVGAGVEGDRL